MDVQLIKFNAVSLAYDCIDMAPTPILPLPQFKLVVNDLLGSRKFFSLIPINDLNQLLSESYATVLQLLYPPEYSADPSNMPTISTVTLFLEEFDGVAFTCADQVHFSTKFLNSIGGDPARVLHEIRGYISSLSSVLFSVD